MHLKKTLKCHENYCKVEMKFHINEDSDFYSLLQSFFHNDLFELHSLDIFEILNLFCAIPGNLMKI